MLFWFVGTSVAAVWAVFGDRTLDWRLVAAGALLPDLLDAPFGGAGPAHALLPSAVLLMVVMVATRGRRSLRKRLLALPMGTFLHLVFDGAWTATTVFWWPVLGTDLGSSPLPSLDRPLAVLLGQELVGLVALWWALGHFLDTDAVDTATEPGC